MFTTKNGMPTACLVEGIGIPLLAIKLLKMFNGICMSVLSLHLHLFATATSRPKVDNSIGIP
jgi:hypothetical protein